MTLNELITQIKDKRAEASIDPLECDPRIRSGAEGLVRAAKDAVSNLERQYKNEVVNHSVVIAVVGDNSQNFADVCANKFHTISINYKMIVNVLEKAIKARGGRNEYGNQEHFIMLSELNPLKVKYEIVSMAIPQINNYQDNVWEQPIYIALDKIFQRSYENSLYSAITRREIGNLALEAEFTGQALPVVVYNYTGGVDSQFLPEPVEVVETNGPIDEDFVKSVLLTVKKKVKDR
jgi:hypothetical protein